MKITHIATAAVVPAAIAGAAISLGASGHPVTRHAVPGTAHRAADATPAPAKSAGATSAPASLARALPSRTTTHDWITVTAGQTLSRIATAHHVTWQAIYATPPNPRVLHDPDLLRAGERLRIPADPKLRAAQFEVRYAARLRQQAAASRPAAASQPGATAPAQPSESGGASLTAGMSSFEQCVAWRESSDTPTDPDGLFGLLPSTWASLGFSGTAGEAPVAVQEEAFSRLYAEDGTAPWAPYDGC